MISLSHEWRSVTYIDLIFSFVFHAESAENPKVSTKNERAEEAKDRESIADRIGGFYGWIK